MEILKYNFIDLTNKAIYPAEIGIRNGIIHSIKRINEQVEGYILPGFIDAHVHIESSMLCPSAFSPAALKHGTVATVSDPHEIANVLGEDGVRFMIADAARVPLKFFFGAPSCVPATPFETAGAELDIEAVTRLLDMPEVLYLAEMMNWPGVLNRDPMVMGKIHAALLRGKRVDGHAPGLKNEEAARYALAGISSDHECFTADEALDKLQCGMHILIREGSAARNFEALHSLIDAHWNNLMFCTDDCHPDDLMFGHINQLVKRAIEKGYDLFKVLQMACVNPIEHYNLPVGQMHLGDVADFIVVENLENWKVLKTYIEGKKVFDLNETTQSVEAPTAINHFHSYSVQNTDFEVEAENKHICVIKAIDGELITEEEIHKAKIENNKVVADIENDILKIAVVNRYHEAKPAVAFIRGFGLKKGAIASSVGHDSHNITVVGTNDDDIAKAVNLIMESKGGLCAISGDKNQLLPLPVAGLMSLNNAETVAKHYTQLLELSKQWGSPLRSPFMTLSFMPLLVIPALKLSDKGLFDARNFSFKSIFAAHA